MSRGTSVGARVLLAGVVAAATMTAAQARAGDPLDTAIDSGPAEGDHVADPAPAFAFSSPSAQATGFECSLDSAAFAPCVSPHVPEPLLDGAHVFAVRAVDGAGGADESPAAVGFTVDTRPPGTRIARGPRGTRHIVDERDEARFRFVARRGGTRFLCRLDKQRWRRCPSPKRVWVGPGRHRLSVRAVDEAGNRDRRPAIRRWRVRRWVPGIGAARSWAADRAGRISFSVDQGWRKRGVRQSATAPMASTLKVMLMVAYLRRSAVRDRSLRSSERTMLSAMIRRSDNVAATRVRDIVGPDALRRLARRARMRDFSYHPVWGLSRTSASDQSSFMRRLQRYVPARHWRFARRELASIVPSQRWGIGAIRIRGWDLHFKGGWGSGTGAVTHQVALLRRGKHRIGIAMLIQSSPSHGYGTDSLREISRRLLRDLPSSPD